MDGIRKLLLLCCLAVLAAACGATDAQQQPQAGQATEAPAAGALTASDIQRIIPSEAKARLDQGDAVLYDARSPDSFQAAHAAGAISLPADEVASRFSELPADKSLIFY
jgi:3-mercaptopyruvate sulfurtransferase SseA